MSSSAELAAQAQMKLEKHYKTVYKALFEYRKFIEVVQHVLVWRRPALSLALYAFVHWIFILQVRSNDGPVSQFGNLLFWLILADVFYRAATKQQSNDTSGNEGGEWARDANGRSKGRSLGRRQHQSQSPTVVPFENAVMKRHTPRGPGELPPFEVICLWLADLLMFLDNTVIVLKHWSINDPFMFSIVVGLPGFVLIFLGRYIPTLVLLYVAVMFLLTWPYIEHHDLRVKFLDMAQAYYPGMLEKAKAVFELFKKMDNGLEFSLSEGDEAKTEQALQEAFDQATGQQNQQRQQQQQLLPGEPGLSLLQDSALGLHPDDFQHSDMDSLLVDSIAPGSGDFPSISHMDESLNLPSFPPHSQGGTSQGAMPPIGEEFEDDTSLALSSQGSHADLDPLLDSIEVEFGYNFTDSHSATGQSRGHRQFRRPQQSSLPRTANRPGLQQPGATQTTGQQLEGYPQGFTPPPTYQAALDGSDGGVRTAVGRDGYEWPIEDPPLPLGGHVYSESGIGVGPKSRSTPLIREGMRRRGKRQRMSQQQEEATAQLPPDNPLFADNSGLLQELDTL